jgi:hypothetical protein
MARGDYAEITYRTGAGVAKEKISATRVGSSVEVNVPGKASDPFVEVLENDKNGTPIRTARFGKTDVVAIIEGHDDVLVRRTLKS